MEKCQANLSVQVGAGAGQHVRDRQPRENMSEADKLTSRCTAMLAELAKRLDLRFKGFPVTSAILDFVILKLKFEILN